MDYTYAVYLVLSLYLDRAQGKAFHRRGKFCEGVLSCSADPRRSFTKMSGKLLEGVLGRLIEIQRGSVIECRTSL
jgi:hypothetical protein